MQKRLLTYHSALYEQKLMHEMQELSVGLARELEGMRGDAEKLTTYQELRDNMRTKHGELAASQAQIDASWHEMERVLGELHDVKRRYQQERLEALAEECEHQQERHALMRAQE